MTLNIIHLPHRLDRLKLLYKELNEQKILDFKIWDGIIDQTNTARGIAQAHKQIVKYAKENNLTEVLIAEDDLHFTSKTSFSFFLANKPNDYDIYLASTYYGTLKENNIIDEFAGLTFYIVDNKFYDSFLLTEESKHLDRGLRKKGKFIVCNPFTVIQHNGFSDNKKQDCNYMKYLEKRSLFHNDSKIY